MARSIRMFYRAQQGTIRKNVNWDAIEVDSAVIITAAEFTFHEGTFGGPKTLGRPNLGAAPVYVTNVGPHGGQPGTGGEAGGVEFLLHVDFSSPLAVIVTITAEDPIESFN
jgi:hypothetical protein